MPNLIVYIPFPEGGDGIDGDIQVNTRELANADPRRLRIDDNAVDSIIMVYQNDAGLPSVVGPGDYLLVHGHGGPDDDTTVGDNCGAQRTVDELMSDLSELDAEFAEAVYFFICYSALQNHIADKWRQLYPGRRVYGAQGEAQGAIIKTTRSGAISGSVFSSGQLILL